MDGVLEVNGKAFKYSALMEYPDRRSNQPIISLIFKHRGLFGLKEIRVDSSYLLFNPDTHRYVETTDQSAVAELSTLGYKPVNDWVKELKEREERIRRETRVTTINDVFPELSKRNE